MSYLGVLLSKLLQLNRMTNGDWGTVSAVKDCRAVGSMNNFCDLEKNANFDAI